MGQFFLEGCDPGDNFPQGALFQVAVFSISEGDFLGGSPFEWQFFA